MSHGADALGGVELQRAQALGLVAADRRTARGPRRRVRARRPTSDDADRLTAELSVVGYSCTLFRDDAAALRIDREEHMIPWMGDSTLIVDRFDARAALDDRRAFVKLKGRAAGEDAEELALGEQLEFERYRDAGEVEHLREQYGSDDDLRGAVRAPSPYQLQHAPALSAPPPRTQSPICSGSGTAAGSTRPFRSPTRLRATSTSPPRSRRSSSTSSSTSRTASTPSWPWIETACRWSARSVRRT